MDEMFFREDGKSLRRGKRRERRTPTCRPCLIWRKDEPHYRLEGVVMDVNRYGLCIRMLEPIEAGTPVLIQLMHDEEFQEPMAPPMAARIARVTNDGNGFLDHGIEIVREEIRRPESRPVVVERRTAAARRAISRMHSYDVTVGDRRTERYRR
jgi:hypothetical protein